MKDVNVWSFEEPASDDLDYIHPAQLAPVPRVYNRRAALLALGALSVLGFLVGCAENSFSSDTTGTSADSSTGNTVTDGSCAVIPSETKGPYPLDGSNGTNALSGIYRSDISGSDITSTSGVPLQITLNLLNTNNSCAPISGAAVYIWHCDQYGQYSGYSSSQNGYHAGKTFCRGIQVSDNNGQVTFTTLYPGWYVGRITHIHLAVYLNNNLNNTPKVSQFAFPQSVTTAVYNTSPYSSHGQNTSVTSFASDNIFSDGTTYQIATVAGSVNTSLTATLNVGLPA